MRLILLLVVLSLMSGCQNSKKNQEKKGLDTELNVIFETDMGNDIDDALALDMLYKYADQKKINLLAVSSNKNSEFSPRYINIMNIWYGYPSVEIGTVENGADSENGPRNYTQTVCEHLIDGKPEFKEEPGLFSESVRLYRKLLSKQADRSVVIISVGFSTNLARLLDSGADEFSDLSGKELVAQKVKFLSAMAGNFSENPPKKEFNILIDVPAARKVFNEWPTPIVVSPFAVGKSILFPGECIENDFQWAEHNPLVLGYKSYLSMPYDRPTWDLTSVLYAVERDQNYFSKSENGNITVDENGFTRFIERQDGNCVILSANPEQQERIKSRFIELITMRPKVFSKEK